MQHAGSHQEPGTNLEMSLREHLLAAGASDSQQHSPYPPPPPQVQGGGNSAGENIYQASNSGSPHEHHLDPSMGGHAMPYPMGTQHTDGEGNSTPSKGKRELSTSKRAAQNRAAQRAFRQRKEGYIKKLEEQVKDFEQMENDFRSLQNENFQLREYILNLQSRLLETQGDVPEAPPNMNLSGSASQPTGGMSSNDLDSPETGSRHGAVARLQAAAAQAEARAQEGSPYHTRDADADSKGHAANSTGGS